MIFLVSAFQPTASARKHRTASERKHRCLELVKVRQRSNLEQRMVGVDVVVQLERSSAETVYLNQDESGRGTRIKLDEGVRILRNDSVDGTRELIRERRIRLVLGFSLRSIDLASLRVQQRREPVGGIRVTHSVRAIREVFI